MALHPKSSLGRLVLRFLDHTQLDTYADTHPVQLPWTTDQLVVQAAIYTTQKKRKTGNVRIDVTLKRISATTTVAVDKP